MVDMMDMMDMMMAMIFVIFVIQIHRNIIVISGGNSICDDEECSMKFPHYYNTTFFVCMSCADTISLKLILQIDLGKLKLLKNKIRTGTTCNSVCSSRTTSREQE